ncbi:MAG: HEPN domain-containing protein [archaeon]
MRQEIINWMQQTQSDFDKATVLKNSKNYDGSVFFYHQCVEKYLKGICLFKIKEIPKGHSLIFLAAKVKLPSRLISGIRDLNPEYMVTRYPDMAAGTPAELYDKTICEKHEKTAKGVMEWAKLQIK